MSINCTQVSTTCLRSCIYVDSIFTRSYTSDNSCKSSAYRVEHESCQLVPTFERSPLCSRNSRYRRNDVQHMLNASCIFCCWIVALHSVHAYIALLYVYSISIIMQSSILMRNEARAIVIIRWQWWWQYITPGRGTHEYVSIPGQHMHLYFQVDIVCSTLLSFQLY